MFLTLICVDILSRYPTELAIIINELQSNLNVPVVYAKYYRLKLIDGQVLVYLTNYLLSVILTTIIWLIF